MSDLVGSTLGQYQVVELIGKGGMAAVYKAWQPSLRRHVALKVLDPQLACDSSFVTRFHQEAVSAANLKHTNIVIIHDVGTQDGFNYIAMEHIDGSSLDERIRSQGALPPEQVVDITTQVGSALDYAHERGFIHRDIKPANVLIDQTGRVVLTDFGIVKALSGSGMTMSLTHSGSVIGTPHYMSPEQVKDEPLDHRSDLYSLGIVCYEMLSGRVPFNNATTHSVLFAQANDPPPPLRDVNAAVVPEVEAVVDKMLAKEPKARYNSASEFARALSAAVNGDVAIVTPGEPALDARRASKPRAATPQRGSSPARRSRWPMVLLGIGVIGALLAVGALAAVFLLGDRDSTEKRLEEAQAALVAGNYTEASNLFEQVLDSELGNTEALTGLLAVADEFAQAEDYDQAIATYEMVLDRDADNVDALKGIGEAFEAQEDWEQARNWYERWTQITPDDADARLKLGWAHFNLEEFENAVAQFSRATGLRPDSPAGFEGLGRSYYALEDYERAIESLEKWSELEPDNTEVPSYLAPSYYEQGDYAKALNHYQSWSATDPDNAAAFLGLGWTYYQLGDFDKAIEPFKRADSLEIDIVSTQRGLAGAFYELGDYSSALTYYERWSQLDADSAFALQGIGRASERLEDCGRAIDAYEQAIALNPELPRTLQGLGRCYEKKQDFAKAATYFRNWTELEPKNAEAFNALGWNLFWAEQYEEAIQAFLTATQLDDTLMRAFLGLGRLYVELDDCDRARPNLERALALDPNNNVAANNLMKCPE